MAAALLTSPSTIARVSAMADALAEELWSLRESQSPAPARSVEAPARGLALVRPRPGRRRPKVKTRPRKWADPVHTSMAADGVPSLTVDPCPESADHRLVRIGHGTPRRMTSTLASLLETLAFDEPSHTPALPDDAFAPWHSLRDLARARGCRPHSITMAVSRLRDELCRTFCVSPMLVETMRGHVRFRIQRGSGRTASAVAG